MKYAHTEKEIEKVLKKVVEVSEEVEENIWVCIGDGKNPHPPIISYGWTCPFCESIGDYEFTIKELEKEVEDKTAIGDVLEEDNEILKNEVGEVEKKYDSTYEKLMEAYRIYPELGI